MSNRSDRTQPDSDSRGDNFGRQRGGYGRDRRPRGAPDGNIAKLEAKSGTVVVIDQFMLGTAQFLKRIGYFLAGESNPVDERSFIEALGPAVSAFGGALLEVEPGEYGVYRDPSSAIMAIAPEKRFAEPEEEEDADEENFGNRIEAEDENRSRFADQGYRDQGYRDQGYRDRGYGEQGHSTRGPGGIARKLIGDRSDRRPISKVFVETRCLVFIDSSHLRDPELVRQYKELRDRRDDKAARDLLRQYSAAVRYGFNRRGDLLGLFKLDEPNSYGLWAAEQS